jgi:hypothetical protein
MALQVRDRLAVCRHLALALLDLCLDLILKLCLAVEAQRVVDLRLQARDLKDLGERAQLGIEPNRHAVCLLLLLLLLLLWRRRLRLLLRLLRRRLLLLLLHLSRLACPLGLRCRLPLLRLQLRLLRWRQLPLEQSERAAWWSQHRRGAENHEGLLHAPWACNVPGCTCARRARMRRRRSCTHGAHGHPRSLPADVSMHAVAQCTP